MRCRRSGASSGAISSTVSCRRSSCSICGPHRGTPTIERRSAVSISARARRTPGVACPASPHTTACARSSKTSAATHAGPRSPCPDTTPCVGDDARVSTELTGHLLISNAALFDPNFRRTVVLMGHHDEEGPVGVVVNGPLDVTADEAVPPLAPLVADAESLFEGGPVQPDGAVVVAEFTDPAVAGVVAFGSVGFLPDEVDEADRGAIVRARVFAGYSGWGPGQLEAELAEDAWLATPATAADVFTAEPERLWEGVIGRLGPTYAMLRSMPSDPLLN